MSCGLGNQSSLNQIFEILKSEDFFSGSPSLGNPWLWMSNIIWSGILLKASKCSDKRFISVHEIGIRTLYNIEKQMSSHASYTVFNPPPTPTPLLLNFQESFRKFQEQLGWGNWLLRSLGCINLWKKHRKNCKCCPGHSLTALLCSTLLYSALNWTLNRCLCSHCSQCLLVSTSVY